MSRRLSQGAGQLDRFKECGYHDPRGERADECEAIEWHLVHSVRTLSGSYQRPRQAFGVDKSVLALPAPRRIRDRDHVKSVAKQPCLVCGRRPTDAHHLRFAQSPALAARSATSSRCRFAGDTIVRCIAVVTKPLGGPRSVWTRPRPLGCSGSSHIRCYAQPICRNQH